MRFLLSLALVILVGAKDANGYTIERTVSTNVEKLSSVEDVEKFLSHNEIAIIGFFKNQLSVGAEILNNTANVLNTAKFGITSNDDVIAKYEAKDGDVLLIKPFDEKKVVFEGELELENLRQFTQVQSLPLIMDYNLHWDPTVFPDCIKAHLLFFVSTLESHVEVHVEPLKDVAREYRGVILFVTISVDVDAHLDVLQHFGVDEEEVPAVVLVNLSDSAKYKPEENDLSPDGIKAFLQDFKDGKLTKYLLAQTLPDDWNQTAVYVLVSSNFDEVAFDKNKDVLVLFYAPWCSYCKQLAPVYEELGEVYKHNDTIIVAKFNSAANELEHTQITLYPTLKLYCKGDNKVIDYNHGMELKNFVEFLESGGDLPISTEICSSDTDNVAKMKFPLRKEKLNEDTFDIENTPPIRKDEL